MIIVDTFFEDERINVKEKTYLIQYYHNMSNLEQIFVNAQSREEAIRLAKCKVDDIPDSASIIRVKFGEEDILINYIR